ncbi:uncharacterized protein LOC132311070 isoform X2 [Cornus florida]|uniref:uncharacterized protein LOC132311070 isoform X2 n=1 Tax=Cornus florida TaxID=4283 RepID=UPI00289B3CFD|nr:uncharacterized protein LOC132311070 isoform X2 [Cornus florida]
MSSGGGSSTNGGRVQSIPSASRKMVQSLKEIVNCPEQEIYAMLKECNMDPNEAVNRLLSQDPFREVKSKREKKKENKETTEFRSRGVSNSSNLRNRGVIERNIGRGSATQFRAPESGALHGKPALKKENGTNAYTSFSSSTPGMSGYNMNRRPPALSDSVIAEDKGSSIGTVDGISLSSQPSSGQQPAWLGVPGQVSMADIVKMGKPHGKGSSTPNPSHHGFNHHSHNDLHSSEGHAFTGQHVSPNDEWPLIEQPQAATMSSVLEPRADSELHANPSNLSFDSINRPQSQADEVWAEEDDATVENPIANHVGPASVSSRKMVEDNTRGASIVNNDLYKNTGSYNSQSHVFKHQEVEDAGCSVSSVTSHVHQLSIQEEDQGAPPEGNTPSLIIPHHLQVQSEDCSHLSFGSFGSSIGTGSSGPSASRPMQSNLEDESADVDASSIGHSDTKNHEYYRDEPLRTVSDGNLGQRTGASDGSYDLPSASQPDVLKQENTEVANGNQYTFSSSSNPGYTFENAQQLNTAFPHSQTSSQMQNLAPFSSVMGYTNSLPSTLLASTVQPVRESDLPYSPFPVAQSMPTKHGNTFSSITGSTISISEALRTANFSSTQPPPQTLPGTSVATGPALPQHLAVHPYSQPTLPLGPYTNIIGYPFLPQNYTYMPSAFQQAFAGNSTYHQSLAAVLPQYKNSVSVSSLPQSAAIASGYGAFGTSTSVPGNFPMNAPAAPGGTTVSHDDVLSSHYKDNSHLISLQQQNENPAMWVHGPGSRTMSAVPASTYYSLQGQNQQLAGFRQGQQPSQNYGAIGYPNFYNSQTGISMEHQQQNPRDGSLGGSQGQPSKQPQQIWQNGY